ncbi:MAG TPA: SpoIID/LytB domain-containing protein [Thermoleophilia bacterium]|nr:SpoIID/LytB domain-containing protein [Thermoleophilia bacterium]
MVRRVFAAAAFSALVLAGAAAAGTGAATPTIVTSSSATTFVITGHGYGHGMGMGQYGAYGYALHGWSYQQILEHYFTGTTIGNDPPQAVRVLLDQSAQEVTLGSAAPWRVIDGAGKRLQLPAGPLVVPASLEVGGHKLVSPLTFEPGKAPVEVGKVAYDGTLTVSADGSDIDLVNDVPLEAYVEGVVPEEMPPSWPEAALEAQAIACRSMVLSRIASEPAGSTFDVYSDGRSQVYGGISAETPRTTRAVEATNGLVVLFDGRVATTYYSSSTGGWTTPVDDGTGNPIPYLVSVSDPYDSLSPDHDWGPVVMSAVGAGKALGVGGPLAGLVVPPSTGHVASALALGPGTDQLTLTGSQVQTDLGLRSTYFQIGMLALEPRPLAVASGAVVTLTGTIVGFPGASLEARQAGGTWTIVAAVTPDKTGAFSVQVSPKATTQYRLAIASAAGALIKVRVKVS